MCKSNAGSLKKLGVVLLLGVSVIFSIPRQVFADASGHEITIDTNTFPLGVITIRSRRSDSLIGIAPAASDGTVGQDELSSRTLSRPGEVLETIPGVIVTQHSGGGKANQFFLRGFNLDHGTDLDTSLDGVPLNLPSHAHGQGYTDLNILIPELIWRIDFRKGNYYADAGDFSSAGADDIQYVTSLPKTILQVEYGSFGYQRDLFASSQHAGNGTLLYAVELYHNDGPWTTPDNYKKSNAVVCLSQGDTSLGYSITAMEYSGVWNATDQIAQRALQEIPSFGLYDSIDPSDGGNSRRYSLSGEWHRADEHSSTKILLYSYYYDMDLFSNFTYFLNSPQGDQIEQQDKRWVSGAKASQTWPGMVGNSEMQNSVGLQIRSDSIQNGLYQTIDRVRTDKVDYSGAIIPAVTTADDVWEQSVSPYAENKVRWSETFRTVLGLRAEYYSFDVNSNAPVNSGSTDAMIVCPKASLVFGPWDDTEYYLNWGLGFHSNDARGVTEHVDPTSGAPVGSATPLVRTQGAEIGVRTTRIKGMQSTLTLWWLDIDSELVFDGDHGTSAPSAPSRRYGIEWANYYTPTKSLAMDADFSFSHAEFLETVIDGDTGLQGRYIPEAVNSVIAAGITYHQQEDHGFFSELRLRFFGPRPLTEDDSVISGSTILLSSKVGYIFNKCWTLSVEGFNLLNREDHEIDYYYPSRLENEPAGPNNGGYNDLHFKPAEPISVRVALTARL
jgi:hypothetical protein